MKHVNSNSPIQAISPDKPARHDQHWNGIASDWQHWEPPLRPREADIAVMESFIGKHRSGLRKSLKALLWGVTPEITRMAWPQGTKLLAVDKSEEMIQLLWPGDIEGQRKAVCANWFDYPRKNAACDAIVGDGVFNLFAFPDEYKKLVGKAHRLLAADGILILRFFIHSGNKATPKSVFEDLRANRIGNFHVFKFRLAMALQESPGTGVRMGDVHNAWRDARIDPDELGAITGWRREAIHTIDHYAGKDSRLSFPLWTQLLAAFAEYFEVIERHVPEYEMGECCPIVAFRRKPGAEG